MNKTFYIGGKRNDSILISQKKNTDLHSDNLLEKINQSIYGRGHFALKSILKACLKTSPKMTLHCPSYNCWFTFDLAVKDLDGFDLVAYASPEELKKNIKVSKHKNCVLIVDYFGVSDYEAYLNVLGERSIKIFDLAHAFPTAEYIGHIMGRADYAFTSLRKILPVADGALAYSKKKDLKNDAIQRNPSIYWRALSAISHLPFLDNFADFMGLRYKLFKLHEGSLVSNFYSEKSTEAFNSLNLQELSQQRKANYDILNACETLKKGLVHLPFKLRGDHLHPLYFPYATKNIKEAQRILLQRKIYAPMFWPELSKDIQVIGLPIDDRYDEFAMKIIIKTIEALN